MYLNEFTVKLLPLHRWHSREQSKVSLKSERSSGAEPETDVSDSSAERFSQPWCSFAAQEQKKTYLKCNSKKSTVKQLY